MRLVKNLEICVRRRGEVEIHQTCQKGSGWESPLERELILLLMRQIHLPQHVRPPDLHAGKENQQRVTAVGNPLEESLLGGIFWLFPAVKSDLFIWHSVR